MSYLTSAFSPDTESLARDFERQLIARQLDRPTVHSRSWRAFWPFSRPNQVYEVNGVCQCHCACR
jgi:hypothetical protein